MPSRDPSFFVSFSAKYCVALICKLKILNFRVENKVDFVSRLLQWDLTVMRTVCMAELGKLSDVGIGGAVSYNFCNVPKQTVRQSRPV